MKLLPLVEVVFVNLVLIALLLSTTGDYGFRNRYWESEGFSPSTARYPFLLIASATNGSTNIPGLLTLDWQQVTVVLLVAVDLVYLWSAMKSRNSSPGASA